MKNYDYLKAKEMIMNEKENIERASLGMHEDWFWTAETIFEDGEFTSELNKDTLIGGIKGSTWATPILEIEYKDGTEKTMNCYTGDSDENKPAHFDSWLGCMSSEVQNNRLTKKIEG